MSGMMNVAFRINTMNARYILRPANAYTLIPENTRANISIVARVVGSGHMVTHLPMRYRGAMWTHLGIRSIGYIWSDIP